MNDNKTLMTSVLNFINDRKNKNMPVVYGKYDDESVQ